jgi:hypothetical protein
MRERTLRSDDGSMVHSDNQTLSVFGEDALQP